MAAPRGIQGIDGRGVFGFYNTGEEGLGEFINAYCGRSASDAVYGIKCPFDTRPGPGTKRLVFALVFESVFLILCFFFLRILQCLRFAHGAEHAGALAAQQGGQEPSAPESGGRE